MALNSPEITILIAEELEVDDIRSLMLTSKTNNAIIRRYQRSIAKSRICRMIFDAQLRPLFRPVLSSKTKNRQILEATTFDVVKELELRAASVQTIFDHRDGLSWSFLDPISIMFDFQDLTPQQIERLISKLKDTCAITDRISDCAATVRRTFQLDPKSPFPEVSEELLKRAIHRARQDLIAALGPLDLALLDLLSVLALLAYGRRFSPIDTITPALRSHFKGFKEVVLQNGTMAVYHSVFPDSYHDILPRLVVEEELKGKRWDAGNRSEAPNWPPSGVLAPLDTVVSNVFLDKVRKIPKNYVDEMDDAAYGQPVFTPRFWLIRRWLDTRDKALANGPPIPEEPMAELFSWAVTQDPSQTQAPNPF